MPITIKPTVPTAGLVRLQGYGATDIPAPWGNVPDGPIHPLARIEAYVGGRTARVISAELSRTEVGVCEVQIEVPSIAPDYYPMNIRVDGEDISIGFVVVVE